MGVDPSTLPSDSIDVLIVGAGFAGIYLLHHLRKLGFNTRIHESSPVLGGIWSWTRYPGAKVDSNVPLYEFSFDDLWKDWNWTQRYPSSEELRAYFRYVDEKLDVSKDVRFSTRAVAAEFDTATNTWVTTSRNGTSNILVRSRFLLLCTGGAKTYIPSFEGADSFKGPAFHTSQWPEGMDLTGKSVGLIGTGASGVQLTQTIAPIVSRLTVFQRTPNLAIPMTQESLSPEMQTEAKKEYPAMYAARRVSACGFDYSMILRKTMDDTPEERRAVFERLWPRGGEFWLGNYYDLFIDHTANTEAYAFWLEKTRGRMTGYPEKLIKQLAPSVPPHPFLVKRPSLEQTYFEAFGLPNVSLVDVNETPIERITPNGILTGDGVEHQFDVLVYATGYDAVSGSITGIDIHSVHGLSVKEKWANGIHTHLGYATHGFPNMLIAYGPQSPANLWNGPTSAVSDHSDTYKGIRTHSYSRKSKATGSLASYHT